MSSLRDHITACGYCGTPMPGWTCVPCAPELAQISTMGQWEDFIIRKIRDQRGRGR